MYTPIVIHNTPTCQPHPWHPSVVYVSEGWNGHKWWMGQTPFPPTAVAPYRDRYELPCVHFSDDGKEWFPIPGNPIEDLTTAEIEAHDYYSDPHLLLRDGVLELYYRFTILQDRQLEGNKTLLFRRTSTDGMHWSERQLVADLRKESDVNIWGEQIISPAIIWTGECYRCWYVDRSSYLTGRKIRCVESFDCRTWSPSSDCVFSGADLDPWHIDVQYYQNTYWMLVYGFDKELLAMFRSSDGISWSFVSNVFRPSHQTGDFWSNEIYRACSVVCEDGVRVYFSAHNGRRSAIGILHSQDMQQFKLVSGQSSLVYWLKTLDDIRFFRRIFNLCSRIFK